MFGEVKDLAARRKINQMVDQMEQIERRTKLLYDALKNNPEVRALIEKKATALVEHEVDNPWVVVRGKMEE